MFDLEFFIPNGESPTLKLERISPSGVVTLKFD